MRIGFRARLLLLAVPPVVVAAIALHLALSRLSDRAAEDAARDTLRGLAAIAARGVEGLDPSDAAAAQAIAIGIGRAAGVRATLIRPDGRVIGDSDVPGDRVSALPDHSDRPEVRDALRTGTGEAKRHSDTLDAPLLYSARRVGDGDRALVLRLAIPMLRLREEARRRDAVIALVSGSTAAAIAIAVWAVAARLGRRVRRMSVVAARMAGGDLDARLDERPRDELSRLAASLNALASGMKRTLEAVESEGRLLRAVIDAMREGVLATGPDGRITLANTAMLRLLGADSDPSGQRLPDLTRSPGLLSALDSAQAGRPAACEEAVAHPRAAVVLATAAPVPGRGGAVLVVHDVTELHRLDQVRRDFVANVSHELRNPVATIQAAVETLAETAADADSADLLAVVHRQAERMAAIVHDLLDLARIESGQHPLAPADVDARDAAEDALEAIRDRAAERRIEVSIDVPPDVPRVRCDPSALATVLGNLLDNAVKYTRPGDRICVRARRAAAALEIEVADTGPGIPETHLPRLFERFYRVDPGRSREVGGTGLGLAIVKHLAQAMGGSVRVRSAVGQGTTFTVSLPID